VTAILLAIWGGLFSIGWCAAAIAGLRNAVRVRRLQDLRAPEPSVWPRLSVVVAACDEEATIGPALATLLAQDYPDLEIVLVDDRSKDQTGRIADAAAERDRRLRVVHVTELPPGWLGKVHAVHRATAISSGAFVLYSDADVHFAPGALRRAIAHAVSEGLDHLAVAPELLPLDPLHDAVGAAFATAFLFGTRAAEVETPGSSAYVGVGAFNLVRREAFDRTPGWEWLRLEVLDDLGLGLMMKNSGGRSAFAIGLDDIRIDWYGSLGAMARGLEKNMFGAFCRYRLKRLVAILAAGALFLPAPLIALLARPRPWVPAAGCAALALVAVSGAVLAARTRRSIVPFLLAPLGAAILGTFVVRSAWRCLRDGGVTWRGTFYPLAELIAGQRVKLGPL
jgi:glycosyltransferase involved in cell wall biosynthesis